MPATGLGSSSAPFWPHAESRAATTIQEHHTTVARDHAATLALHCNIERILPTMPPADRTALSDAEYLALTRSLLDGVEAQLDAWLQQDVIDIDAQRTGGLLELSFPNGTKIILNTQPPLHEVWMAARSGGFHYRHAAGQWIDTRDGREFLEALSVCTSEQGGKPLRFSRVV